MIKSNIRNEAAEVVRVLAETVGISYGPKGRNVVMFNQAGQPWVTKDGVSISRGISFGDPFEDLIAALVRSAAEEAVNVAGDGTTATTLMTHYLLEALNQGFDSENLVALRHAMDTAVKGAITKLEDLTHRAVGRKEIYNVARIATNGNGEAAELCAKAFAAAGPKGVVNYAYTGDKATRLEISDGYQLYNGFASPYFYREGQVSVLKNPHIVLVHDASSNELQGFLSKIAWDKITSPVVFIFHTLRREVLEVLVSLNQNKSRPLQVYAVQAPNLNEQRKELLMDLSALLATPLVGGKAAQVEWSAYTLPRAGRCGYITVTGECASIYEPEGTVKEELAHRLSQLERQIEMAPDAYTKEITEERLARLVAKVCTLHIGGTSQVEISEAQDLYDDALRACKCAAEGGIVPGGAIAILYAANKYLYSIRKYQDPKALRERAAEVLAFATERLFKTLHQADFDTENLVRRAALGQTVDALTGKHVPAFTRGIVDPADVVKSILVNSVSAALSIYSSSAALLPNPAPKG